VLLARSACCDSASYGLNQAAKPVFFNSGLFQTGAARRGDALRGRPAASALKFDMLFDTRLQRHPLVTSPRALAERHQRTSPFASPDETKDHGEAAAAQRP